jgi:hypothetical protein
MESDGLDWPAFGLAAAGAPFTVVSPPELVAHLRDLADRFGAAAARPAVPEGSP